MAQTATFWREDATEITEIDPLEFGPLDGDAGDTSAWTKVTAKLPTGFVSTGNVVIDATGTSDAKFRMSVNSDGSSPTEYGAALTVTSPNFDDAPGMDFYVQAKADAGETAANDTSVSFGISGTCLAQ